MAEGRRIIDALYDKQLLLILDNCEHLLSACRQLVITLLAETSVSILTTSREPLSVTDERLYAAHVSYSPHQTLRAAIDWSYDLLTAAEQMLLRRLSVFASGCSLNTAETVCAGDGIEREQVLELLTSLVNKSFVGQ